MLTICVKSIDVYNVAEIKIKNSNNKQSKSKNKSKYCFIMMNLSFKMTEQTALQCLRNYSRKYSKPSIICGFLRDYKNYVNVLT